MLLHFHSEELKQFFVKYESSPGQCWWCRFGRSRVVLFTLTGSYKHWGRQWTADKAQPHPLKKPQIPDITDVAEVKSDDSAKTPQCSIQKTIKYKYKHLRWLHEVSIFPSRYYGVQLALELHIHDFSYCSGD